MPINFEHEIEGDLLKVVSSGTDDTLQEVTNYGMAILGIAIDNDCTRIFCDERKITYNLAVIDTYQLAESAANLGIGLKQIAIVCQPKDIKEGRFFETVSKNRGLNVLLTLDYAQAEEWLNNKGKTSELESTE